MTKKVWKEKVKGIGEVIRIKRGLSAKETFEIWDREVKKGKPISLTDALINLEEEQIKKEELK